MATLSTFAAFSSRGFGGGGASSLVLPTGGNYIIENNGAGKRVHVFTSTGTFTVPSNIITPAGYFSMEVLVVGGGSAASGEYGGGGGGGAVVYTSDFRIAKGQSFTVTVGGAGGNSSFPGIPMAHGGGAGQGGGEYSRGNNGGCGGGGSWHNGRPNGNLRTTSRPGHTWGTTGPTQPGTYSPAFTAPQLGPNYADYCSITREYGDGFHDQGNGNYQCTSNVPSSALGVAAQGPYTTKGFRARGGGGAAWSGGLGGQGAATRFLDPNDTTWTWVCGGGNGKPADDYNGRAYAPSGQRWRDSGVDSGTYYPAAWVAGSTAIKFESGADNVSLAYPSPIGQNGYGGGGCYSGGRDGNMGIIAIRYDLSSYPGGLAAASANIFGGTIAVSSNGKYRYHTFAVGADRLGTGANSQTWYINSDYRPRYFPSTSTDTEWPQKTAPSANTEPFYYYGDIPSTTFEYLIIGGGGSYGYSSDATSDAYHGGGGGAGGIKFGTIGRDQRLTYSHTFNALPDDLTTANSSIGQTTGTFDMRPGFIEVYANSLLNSRMWPGQYEYSIARNPAKDSREQNGTIKIRGTVGTGSTQQARILRCVYEDEIGEGIWGSNTNGSAGPNANRAYYYILSNSVDNTNPDSAGWGDSVYLSSYDAYFYSGFVKVLRSKSSLFATSLSATTNYIVGHTLGTWTGPGTAGTKSAADAASYFNTTDDTRHPSSNERYYNCIRINTAIPRWSNGTDKWSAFWAKVTGFNSSSPGWETGMTNGLNNIDPDQDRPIIGLSAAALGGTGDLKIQYCLENSTGATSRKFEYFEGSGDLYVPAGWKMVENNSFDANGNPNGFTQCLTGSAIEQTKIRLYKWHLRRLYIRRLFVLDIQVGLGGAAGAVNPVSNRSGAPSSIHKMNSDDGTTYFSGGGGAGGFTGYTSAAGFYGPAAAQTGEPRGRGNLDGLTLSGAAGGGLWLQGTSAQQGTSYASNPGNTNGAQSDGVDAYGAGGTGGGSVGTRDFAPYYMMGAPRGAALSQGKRNNTNSRNGTDTGHGGRGYFGGSQDWAWEVRTITCESPAGTPRPQVPANSPYPEYYYYINVNQFPHNSGFSSGGGGGAGGNGSDGSTTVGGAGGSGYTSSITGFSTVYGHGGGGFGRRRNGTPGNSQPFNPADQTVPAGAPDSPAYLPYGGGGGWSYGRQEGLGVNATGYWPGNAPWPVSYDVSSGQEHMDAMRYWSSPVPAPQKGDLGSAYSGKQGVVIIAYNRAPLIYI